MTVEVTIYRDPEKTIVYDTYNGPVTVALSLFGGGTAVLSGTLIVNAVNGVATFSDLSIDKPHYNYQLRAHIPTPYLQDDSVIFSITPLALRFTVQPSNAVYPNSVTAEITAYRDVAATVIETNYNGTFNVLLNFGLTSIGTPALVGNVGGFVSVNAVNGVASLNIGISGGVGDGLSLQATLPTDTFPLNITADSDDFNYHGTLAFTIQPTVWQGFGLNSTSVQSTPVATNDLTLSLATNPNSATLFNTNSPISGGPNTMTFRGSDYWHGVNVEPGTYAGLAVDANGTMTLQASATYFQSTTSNSFTVDYQPAFYTSASYLTQFSATTLANSSVGTLSCWYKLYPVFVNFSGGYTREIPLLAFAAQNGAVNSSTNAWAKCSRRSYAGTEYDGFNLAALPSGQVFLEDSTFGKIAQTNTPTHAVDTNWHHIMIAWQTSGTRTIKVVVDGASESGLTYSDNGNNFSVQYNGLIPWIGALPNGVVGSYWFNDNWAFTELYFNSTVFLDPTIASNVNLFRDSVTHKPIFLGNDGSGPTGLQPDIYLTMKPLEKFPAFLTNRGSMGNFTAGLTGFGFHDNTYSSFPISVYSIDSPY